MSSNNNRINTENYNKKTLRTIHYISEKVQTKSVPKVHAVVLVFVKGTMVREEYQMFRLVTRQSFKRVRMSV